MDGRGTLDRDEVPNRGNGMKCYRCSKPATIHLTDIVNGKKTEIHLCQECAEAQEIVKKATLNIGAIVETVIGHYVSPVADELARLTCPVCGIKYMEFRAAGRLGCPEDYSVFHQALLPLLRRIHRRVQHEGKIPRRSLREAAVQAELLRLRKELRHAVETENYEEAARLRDLLRLKEQQE